MAALEFTHLECLTPPKPTRHQHPENLVALERTEGGWTERARGRTAVMSESEDESKGFKVTDRRKFTSEGKPRDESGREPAASPEPTPERVPPAPAPETAARPPAVEAPPGPQSKGSSAGASFLDLVGMLATNAMLQLGDVPNPVSGERAENLQAVQDMISFLEVLEQKTKGNLDQQEAGVLEQVLYDLRMRYMAKAKILDS